MHRRPPGLRSQSGLQFALQLLGKQVMADHHQTADALFISAPRSVKVAIQPLPHTLHHQAHGCIGQSHKAFDAINFVALHQLGPRGQQALSVAADVSRRMLVGIESGDANVSLNTLDRIAEALRVSFADLVKAPAKDLRRIEALAWQGRMPGSQAVLLATAPAAPMAMAAAACRRRFLRISFICAP